MTQFMIARSAALPDLPSSVVARAINDEFLKLVASEYFGIVDDCWAITDNSGRTEPLIDDVWEAQRAHQDPSTTPFMQMLTILADHDIEFICWCSSDFHDLPKASSLEEIRALVLSQTALQPADLYIHFQP